MNDEHSKPESESTGEDGGSVRRHGGARGRKTRFAVLAAVLLGAGVLMGGLGSMALSAYAVGGSGHHGGHGKGPQRMMEHARKKVSWMLAEVDATEEQESQIDAIVSETIERVGSFREDKRGARKAFMDELLQSDINRDSLEQLRQRHLASMDQMSAAILDGAVRAAEVLTPEQREQVRELAQSRHESGHKSGHRGRHGSRDASEQGNDS